MTKGFNLKLNAAKFLLGAFAVLASYAGLPVDKANAAATTTCYYGSGPTYSLVNQTSVTDPTDPTQYSYSTSISGTDYTQCAASLADPNSLNTYSVASDGYYSTQASAFVSDGTSCNYNSTGANTGTYTKGLCIENMAGNTPGSANGNLAQYFNNNNSNIVAPSGYQKPMCVSGNPVAGAAIGFVIIGGVICEQGLLRNGNIYAFDGGNRNNGWFGINAGAIWSRDAITSSGLLTSFGGANLLSQSGNTGLVIYDDTIFLGSSSGDAKNDNDDIINRNAGLLIDTSTTSTGPAASLNGSVGFGDSNNLTASKIGVSISGDGAGGRAFENGNANWADVLISSINYNPQVGTDGLPDFSAEYKRTRGSAIIVNDYGVQIVTPAPIHNQTITNSFGANNQLDPLIGGTTINNIGGGNGTTINNFGNDNADSSVNLTAANALQVMQYGSMYSTLGTSDPSSPSNGSGDSVLPKRTPTEDVDKTSTATTSILRGIEGPRTVVDQNGKLTIRSTLPDDPRNQTSSSMTVTNGYGNTHGFMVNETQAVISGGINSTTQILDDRGVTFSNSATGAPVQVHGVFDGTDQFDAVNVRQLYGAVAASMATVPNFTVEPGETGIGFGTAMMGQYPAVGMSFAKKNKNGSQINVGIAAAEHVPVAVRAGFGWVW